MIVVFNGSFGEYLNESKSLSLEDAREKVEEWRQRQTLEKLPGSLGNRPPVEYKGI